MNKETITLQELIEAIENCGIKKEIGDYKNILFDFGTAIPTGLISWRGSYSELSLEYKLTNRDDNSEPQCMHADKFLEMCKEAIGSRFEGYKGGEFTMNKDTLVYVDNYGAYTETIISGVKSDDYYIYIKTDKQTFN